MKDSSPPLVGTQFSQRELHLRLQAAVRTLQAHTRACNSMLLTCYQEVITPKRDLRWLDRW